MVISPLNLFLIALIALFVGILSIIAGLGGGVFLTPILTILFNLDITIVIGSELFATIVYSFIGSINAKKRNEVDFRFAFAFLIPSIIATLLGSFLTDIIPEYILLSILFALSLLLSIKMLLESRKRKKLGVEVYKRDALRKLKGKKDTISQEKQEEEEKEKETREKIRKAFFVRLQYPWLKPFIKIRRKSYEYKISIPVIVFFGFLVGFITGLLGSSGGWIITPLMILGFGYTPLTASGTSLFIILIKAIIGASSHAFQGHFNLSLMIVLTIFLPIGGFIGDLIKRRLKNRIVGLILGFCLLAVSAVILIFYFIL